MTRKNLEFNARTFRSIFNRPEDAYVNGKANVGYIGVAYNTYYGYSIFELLTESGAEHTHESGMTLKECKAWFRGALAATRIPKRVRRLAA